MASSTILLKGGTLLLPTSDNTDVTPVKSDLLVSGSRIEKIAASIKAPSSATRVIDCTDKIISPGFVDTHRHLWQTQLKGRHADELLFEYMLTGNFAGSFFEPDDVYWGQLAGVLESLDAGTTTIVDHSHIIYSEAHARAALNGTIDGGVRSIFCPAAADRVKAWSPHLEMEPELFTPAFEHTIDSLLAEKSWADGRVTLGFAMDAWYKGPEVSKYWIDKVRKGGVKLITAHSVAGPSRFDPMPSFRENGLLSSDILLSHFTCPTESDISLLRSKGAHVSSTPSSELQMAHGDPICFHPQIFPVASLGIDCHSAAGADIITQMRLVLQHARHVAAAPSIAADKLPKNVGIYTREVYHLATVGGARAAGLENEIGSLKEGMRADLLVWDALSPAMLAGATYDPVKAIVHHSSPQDIEYVLVDGRVVKDEGKLVATPTRDGMGTLKWRDVAREVMRSREGIEEKANSVDWVRAAGESPFRWITERV